VPFCSLKKRRIFNKISLIVTLHYSSFVAIFDIESLPNLVHFFSWLEYWFHSFFPINELFLVCGLPLCLALGLCFVPSSDYLLIRQSVIAVSVLNVFYSQSLVSSVIRELRGVPKTQLYEVVAGSTTGYLTGIGITFSVAVDGISLFFIVLTTLIFPFCFFGIYKKTKNLKLYCWCLLVLEGFLLLAFSAGDLFFF
jgi:NADH-quinone oxidoreductase subunit M